jgi:hypothetical protein
MTKKLQVLLERKVMRKIYAVILVAVLVWACFLVLVPSAKADYKTITFPTDYTLIQDAIDNAAAGSTILVKAGIYDGPKNQTITINKPLTIIGDGAEVSKINLHPADYMGSLFGVPWPAHMTLSKLSQTTSKYLD